LADEGEILRLTCGDGSDRFDGNPKPHYHFLCTGCGRVIDLDLEPMNHIDVLAAADFDGTIEGHTVLFHGKCGCCKTL
jgi:Fur family peroxide stress response transcriptional regulator